VKSEFRSIRTSLLLLSAVASSAVSQGATVRPPFTTKAGEWPSYTGDTRGSRYSPLEQINAANFSTLEVAWRFKTDSLGPRPEFKLEGTPLMVGGTLYATGGTGRAVVALDAVTGARLWVHREDEGERGAAAARPLSGRGLSYWTDGREERILYVTPGYRLVALNAKTGEVIPSFGTSGAVDLKTDIDQTIFPDLVTGEIGFQGAPVVARDVVIIGAAFKEGTAPKSFKNNKGYIRGFDARTGKRLWTFHTIPKKGEPGYDTWHDGSAEVTARVEQVQKSGDELGFLADALTQLFTIRSASLAATRDVWQIGKANIGAGARVNVALLPQTLELTYQTRTPTGFAIYVRLR